MREALVFRTGRTRCDGHDVALRGAQVEHQHRTHRGCLQGRRFQPLCAEAFALAHVDHGPDHVVLLDDALVEAIGLFIGEQQRGLDHRLLTQLFQLEAGAEHHARQDQHR